MKRASGGALTALVWMVAIGCGGSENAQPATGPDAAEPSNTGMQDAGDAAAPLPPPPPPPPLVDGKPVVGIFVSSSKGHDDGDATVNRPVKTLSRALAIALEKKDLSIIACTETFKEQLTLPAGDTGVTLLGNYDCQLEWKQVSSKAKIVSPASPAVRAEGLKMPSRIEGFEIIAPDQTGALADGAVAQSSYGMFVKDAVDLTLTDLRIVAGKGQDGVDGVEPAPGTTNGWVTPSAANGKAPDGPAKRSCADGNAFCNFNVSNWTGTVAGAKGGTGACKQGGAGGAGGAGGEGRGSNNGSYIQGVEPFQYEFTYGQPHSATNTTAARNTTGAAGGRGAFGANGQWVIKDTGFEPASGSTGGIGLPGQGGGGGDGVANYGSIGSPPYTALIDPPDDGIHRTGIGGGGGAGGCGGLPGTAGRGGGASIGLFVVDSHVTITAGEIVGGTGGRGGFGAPGTAGTPGGPGGTMTIKKEFAGNNGGNGGPGGPAGLSGHGSAGPSIALVFHGTRPTTANVQLKLGQPGEGGTQVIDGSQTLPAAERIAKQEHSF